MVPKRDTLAEMVEGFRQMPPLTEQQSEVMAAAVAWANDWSNATESVDWAARFVDRRLRSATWLAATHS
jgi:hypothetical protein